MKLIALASRAAEGYRGHFAWVVTLGFLVAALESVTLIALFQLVSRLAGRFGDAPRISAAAMPFDSSSPIVLALAVLALATLRFCLTLRLEWDMSRFWVRLREHMQNRMLALHLDAQYRYLIERKAGEHLHNLLEGPAFAAVFYLHLARFLSTAIMLACLLLTLSVISPALMALALGVALAYGLIIRSLSIRLSLRIGQRLADALKSQTQLAAEGLSGVRYLKTLSASDRWARHFAEAAGTTTRLMTRSGFWNTVLPRTLEYAVLLFFITAVLYALTIGQDVAGMVPTMAVYFLGIVRMLPSLAILGSGRMQMMQTLPNLRNYVELQEAIRTEGSARPGPAPPPFAGRSIGLDGLWFSYGEQPVLRGLTCRIPLDGVTAIVGASGQGKSTLIDILLRLVEPERGAVMLDGQEVRQFSLASWRQRFAYVGQEPFLFHETVADNIRLGRPAASDSEVREAARQACALDFIEAMPRGFATVLADRGQSLSGGQRQRIALARALVSDAHVLLLDEPTSQLDAETEAAVLSGLLEARRGRGMILVTHREDLLRQASQVLVMRDGMVVEEGTQQALRATGRHYRQMFKIEAE